MQFQRLFPSSQSPHPSPPQHHINTIRSNRATEQLLKSRRVPALGISYFLSLYSSQPCSLSLCRTQDQRGQHPQHLDLEDLKRVSHLPWGALEQLTLRPSHILCHPRINHARISASPCISSNHSDIRVFSRIHFTHNSSNDSYSEGFLITLCWSFLIHTQQRFLMAESPVQADFGSVHSQRRSSSGFNTNVPRTIPFASKVILQFQHLYSSYHCTQ